MKFYNINWTSNNSGKDSRRIQTASLNGLPTEMDVSCDCGHRWHSTRGNTPGQIANGVHGEVTCPACGDVDSYQYSLAMAG